MNKDSSDRSKFKGFSTKSVHSGEKVDPITGSVTTPIYQTSNFAFKNTQDLLDLINERKEGYIYTRYGNPTNRAVERKLAELENVDDAVAFSSGMAAISSTIMTLVSSGDHIVSVRDVYGGTFVLLNSFLPLFGVETTFVDTISFDDMEEAVRDNTKLIFVESPTNPMLKIVDLARVGKLGKKVGVKTVIDNTFSSPYNQQPVKFGFDVIIHSATKYLGGHNDLTAGIVCGEEAFIKEAKDTLKILGGVLDPHCAFLLLRGIKTLAVRVEKQNRNGMEVAKYLESHPKVDKVYYPGLESHPQHKIAKRQMTGFGDVVSFELKRDLETTIKFVDSMRLAFLTPSLGGTETLITQPATTSHYKVPKEERLKQGITDSFIRLSLGIEDAEDVIADLEQALEKV